MNNANNTFYPIGRALIGALFAVSGVNKILGFSYVSGWMASSGLPMAHTSRCPRSPARRAEAPTQPPGGFDAATRRCSRCTGSAGHGAPGHP
jgi:hypothetical protein